MKKYFGNYLGICIDNNDPQKRGRVQVFIPHIMPALFENWNEAGEDIQMLCVGDNLPQSLPAPIVEKLKKILPWSEAASPIMGTSAPGNLEGSNYTQFPDAECPPGTTPVLDPTTNINNVTQPTGQLGPAGALLIPSVNPNLNTSGLNSTFVQRLNGFYNEARSLGYNVSITSGYRSTERQRQLYNNSAKDGSVAPPGSSAHEFGIAADIRVTGNGVNITSFRAKTDRTTNSDTPAFRSLLAKYGLHQPLHPIVKPSGISEHWHVEPIETNTASRGGRGASQFQAITNSLGGIGTGAAGANPGNLVCYPTSTSAGMPAPNPLSSPNPLDERASIANPTTENTGGGGGTLSVPGVGQVSGATGAISGLNSNMSSAFREQYSRVYSALEGTRFAGGSPPPRDGAQYGITKGTREEWANFFTRLASVESGFRPDRSADINGGRSGPLTSFGLYQMGRPQFNTYGGGNILNANDNTRAFVRYAESLYFGGGSYGRGGGTNVISGRSGNQWLGLAAAYGPLRRTLTNSQNQNESQLLAQNIAASERQSGGYTGGQLAGGDGLPQQDGSMVLNTDNSGPAPMINMNNMAAGMFSYPAAGALLWVFFREGNPLFPVYFAANYGEREWASAYRLGSDGVGYKPAPTPENPVTSVGGTWNVGKVGVHKWHYVNDPSNPVNNERSYAIGGFDGSNLAFTEGKTYFTTQFDFRETTNGDKWVYVGGSTEEFYHGATRNINNFGDIVIRYGNTSPEAVAAAEKIVDYINQIMAPLAESTTGTNAGGARGTGAKNRGAGVTGGTEARITSPINRGFRSVAENVLFNNRMVLPQSATLDITQPSQTFAIPTNLSSLRRADATNRVSIKSIGNLFARGTPLFTGSRTTTTLS